MPNAASTVSASPFTSRTRSIYSDRHEPATEFIPWLIKIWDGLTPEQKATATMEARHVGNDMTLVGLRFNHGQSVGDK